MSGCIIQLVEDESETSPRLARTLLAEARRAEAMGSPPVAGGLLLPPLHTLGMTGGVPGRYRRCTRGGYTVYPP